MPEFLKDSFMRKFGLEVLKCVLVGLISFLFGSTFTLAQEPEEKPAGYWNVPFKTMGGQQFWTDARHLDGWRIQKNHVTGHHRLLDTADVRRAWGNLAHCNSQLDEIAAERNLKPYSGRVVILLHGLNRAHSSMAPLAEHLKNEGFQVINFQYASGRAGIQEHAAALRQIVEGLGDDVTEINFVAHSMGNIVVRHYLQDSRDETRGNEEGDSRIKRMVMLGPPNQGSKMARIFRHSTIFATVAGASGNQLGASWEKLESRLATPRFQFGIIAGGREEGAIISNPLLSGQDDLIVTVEETKLPGAHDMVVRPFEHTFIMKKPETFELTTRFLKEGYFLAEEKRNPIPVEATK